MKDAVLVMKDISKSYFGVYAVEQVSFSLHRGEILGLVGENGAGKSTLMNIVGGVIKPDDGFMQLEGSCYMPRNPAEASRSGIFFVHQELNLFNNLSIEENIFIDRFPRLGKTPFFDKGEIRKKTKQLLDSVGLCTSPDMLVESLSPGERQLVEIARALSTDPKIIIFDEPTTSLTERETKLLFELIRSLSKGNRSIIYITHILNDVMQLSDTIMVLRDGKVVETGKKSEYTINKMIQSMVGRDIKQLFPKRTTVPGNEKIMDIKGITQKSIVKDISFSLNKGEVLGIFGLMGSGRTELARIIFGLDPFESGEIIIDGLQELKLFPGNSIKRKVAFVTENRREEGLLMDTCISENVSMVALPQYASRLFKILQNLKASSAIKAIVSSLQIKSGDIAKNPPRSLSGGNQQKVVIGKWLMAKPSVLIMDEPTRGIDVGAKYEVYNIINQLAGTGAGILVISSEVEELIGICDRILVMSGGEVVGNFKSGEYDREKIMAAAFRQDEAGVQCDNIIL